MQSNMRLPTQTMKKSYPRGYDFFVSSRGDLNSRWEPNPRAAGGRRSEGVGLCRNRSYASGSEAERDCFKRGGVKGTIDNRLKIAFLLKNVGME